MKRVLLLVLSLSATLLAAPPASAAAAYWTPVPGVQWQWYLAGNPSASQIASEYAQGVRAWDIDGDGATALTVSRIHAAGPAGTTGAVCYIDAGGWEDYRSDAASFPKSVLGKPIDGWPSERWLDIRQTSILLPLMRARMQTCKDKGFDAVEPDLLDGYSNATGFPLTKAHQLAYNRAIAAEAHALSLSVAQKGAPELAPDLVQSFDWTLNEQCIQYAECGPLQAYKSAGKAIWITEYSGTMQKICSKGFPLAGQAVMKKPVNLTAKRTACTSA